MMWRPRLCFLVVLACATAAPWACGSPPPTGNSDGATAGDGGVDQLPPVDATAPTADMAALACSDIEAAVSQYFDANRTCMVDSDCTFSMTRCGLEGECGDYIAKSGVAGLNALVGQWLDGNCAAAVTCPPCSMTTPAPPACNGGSCGRALPMRIGDACSGDMDCANQGMGGMNICLLGAPFTGGYCSLVEVDCVTQPDECPTGSLCRQITIDSVGQSVTEDVCLKACAVGGDCRTGYTCCPMWNPGPPGNACHPSPCPQ